MHYENPLTDFTCLIIWLIICKLPSVIFHLSLTIRCFSYISFLTHAFFYPTSVLSHPSFVLSHLSFVIFLCVFFHPPSVSSIQHQSSFYLSPIICHLSPYASVTTTTPVTRHICHLRDLAGFGGLACERAEPLLGGVASFDGDRSFLQFESLGYHVRDYVQLELRFRPEKTNGLLLYNGYREDR